MEMSKGEIVASYRQAADPKKQIGILAGLNACEKRDMQRYERSDDLSESL